MVKSHEGVVLSRDVAVRGLTTAEICPRFELLVQPVLSATTERYCIEDLKGRWNNQACQYNEGWRRKDDRLTNRASGWFVCLTTLSIHELEMSIQWSGFSGVSWSSGGRSGGSSFREASGCSLRVGGLGAGAGSLAACLLTRPRKYKKLSIPPIQSISCIRSAMWLGFIPHGPQVFGNLAHDDTTV